MANDGRGEHDGHAQEAIEMLWLYEGEEHGEPIEHDEHLVYKPYPYPVLVAVYHEVDASDQGAQQYKRERDPFVQLDIS